FTVDGKLKIRQYTSTWAQSVPNYTPVEYSQVKPTDLSNPYIEPLTWRDRITDIEEVPIINPEVIPDNFPTEIEIEIPMEVPTPQQWEEPDRKSTRLNSSHVKISYAVFCLKKKIYIFIKIIDE